MRTQPFKRLNIILSALSAISNNAGITALESMMKMEALANSYRSRANSYRSRGKGGKTPKRTGHAHMAYVRSQRKKVR